MKVEITTPDEGPFMDPLHRILDLVKSTAFCEVKLEVKTALKEDP